MSKVGGGKLRVFNGFRFFNRHIFRVPVVCVRGNWPWIGSKNCTRLPRTRVTGRTKLWQGHGVCGLPQLSETEGRGTQNSESKPGSPARVSEEHPVSTGGSRGLARRQIARIAFPIRRHAPKKKINYFSPEQPRSGARHLLLSYVLYKTFTSKY